MLSQDITKMPVLTRSTSATCANKPYLTPQTPLLAHPRARVDTAPLLSPFDRTVEARGAIHFTPARVEGGRSIALPSISEKLEDPLSDPVRPVVRQLSVINNQMDYEDVPIVFSELLPPPTSVPPFVHGEAVTSFFPHQYPKPPVVQAPTNQESLFPSELNNSATFPNQTACYNLPSTSVNPVLHFPPQEYAPFQPPQVNEQPQHGQTVERDTVYVQYPTVSPPTCPTTPPILSGSAPVQNIMHLPPTQSFPTLAEAYPRPMFIPVFSIRQRSGVEHIFGPGSHHHTHLSSWRLREIERQREMDRIAEPYLAHLREVSRRKKAEAEACALAGKQKTDRAREKRRGSWWSFLRKDERKRVKGLTDVERQQRSEERRQTGKTSRQKRGSYKSGKIALPQDLGLEVSVSPRRKNKSRSKPYSVPKPATRSPRRSHAMPGGFDSDDLTQDHQTGVVSDVGGLWKGLRSVVEVGYRLWAT